MELSFAVLVYVKKLSFSFGFKPSISPGSSDTRKKKTTLDSAPVCVG